MGGAGTKGTKGVAEVLSEHNQYIDSLVGAFEDELRGMVASAQAKVLGELQKRLSITDGVIDKTPANQRVLRQVDDFMRTAMDRAGYPQLAEEFVGGFNGQLPYFDEMLDSISANLKRPLETAFSKADVALFESQQISALESLGAIVDTVAAAVKKRALMSVGALPFGDLAEQISTTFGRSISEAATLAETSTTMFFRTVTDRGFRRIEQNLPAGWAKFKYEGPRDKLTRPFCQRMLERTAKEPLKREQIEALDNGQIPNPFVSGGGYNCRHQWILTAPEETREPHRAPVVPARDAVEASKRAEGVVLEGISNKRSHVETVANKKAVAESLSRTLSGDKAFRRLAAAVSRGDFSSDPVEDACAFLVHQWARTSADENEYSLAMQLAAEKEFGLRPWKPFRHKSQWRTATNLYRDHGGAFRSFVRAQYDQTQRYFRERGVDSVYVFRGMDRSKGLDQLRKPPGGKTVATMRHRVPLQPMSSFSADFNESLGFAGLTHGTILAAEVPAGRVLSICRTGFGCLSEVEVVVLSGEGQFWEMCWTGRAGPTLNEFGGAIRTAK